MGQPKSTVAIDDIHVNHNKKRNCINSAIKQCKHFTYGAIINGLRDSITFY